MKHFLIATAALSLIGGAAFAQTTPNADQTQPAFGPAPTAQSATNPQTLGNPNTGSGSTSSTSGASMPSSSNSMPSSGASDAGSPPASDSSMASNAPAGAAPAAYPVCTSKHEDRCVNRSQATRMASNGGRTHHMRSTTTTTTTTEQTPGAAPGL